MRIEDPIKLEMLWHRLLSISDEMAITLTRTAFSMNVRDSHDYGCSIFDAKGNMIAIGQDATPGLSVSAMVTIQNMLEVFPPETLLPGDVLITNDPWLATGHLPDLSIVTPVFYDGNLVGYAASVAHHMDIGGRKYTPATTEIYEEGLFLPVLKLYDREEPNTTLFRILEENVRMPDLVLGDVHGQVAANLLGARRICDLLRENEWTDLHILSESVLNKSEASMREAIEAIPDGMYQGELVIDGFDEDLLLVATITVSKNELTLDFTGTSTQIDRGINCVLPITQGIALLGLQLTLQSEIPVNSGLMRPLSIIAPSGSLLAAEYPAPVVGRSLVLDHIQPLIFLTLAEVIPHQICAVSGGPIWTGHIYGYQSDGNPFLVIQQLNGGMGARPYLDGISALSFPNNIAMVPAEIFETGVPIMVECKRLICDSGGAGRNRGGLGQEFRVRALADKIALPIRADRTRNPPPGLFGGLPGKKGSVVRNGTELLHPKKPVIVQSGEYVSWQLPGGGGYGDPLSREPERVLMDVVDELVTKEAARRDYGVIIKWSSNQMEIDLLATESLRKQIRNKEVNINQV